MGDMIKAITDDGVTVVIVAMFLIGVIQAATKLKPSIDAVKDSMVENKVVIANNSEAIREFAKSNDNLARALELFNTTLSVQNETLRRHESDAKASFERVNVVLDKHTETINDLSTEVSKVNDAVRLCLTHNNIKPYRAE